MQELALDEEGMAAIRASQSMRPSPPAAISGQGGRPSNRGESRQVEGGPEAATGAEQAAHASPDGGGRSSLTASFPSAAPFTVHEPIVIPVNRS